jgi:hypothetical protein
MSDIDEDIEVMEIKSENEGVEQGPDARDTSARSERERVQTACTEHVPKIPKYLVGGGCSGGGLH